MNFRWLYIVLFLIMSCRHDPPNQTFEIDGTSYTLDEIKSKITALNAQVMEMNKLYSKNKEVEYQLIELTTEVDSFKSVITGLTVKDLKEESVIKSYIDKIGDLQTSFTKIQDRVGKTSNDDAQRIDSMARENAKLLSENGALKKNNKDLIDRLGGSSSQDPGPPLPIDTSPGKNDSRSFLSIEAVNIRADFKKPPALHPRKNMSTYKNLLSFKLSYTVRKKHEIMSPQATIYILLKLPNDTKCNAQSIDINKNKIFYTDKDIYEARKEYEEIPEKKYEITKPEMLMQGKYTFEFYDERNNLITSASYTVE